MVIAEWCFALNYANTICVWEYVFCPREYLYQQLEARFNRIIASRVCYEVNENSTAKDKQTKVYLKPSDMLNIINSFMSCLLRIENYALIDTTKAFNNVLYQQTQLIDPNGQPTVTKHYFDLYVPFVSTIITKTHFYLFLLFWLLIHLGIWISY